MNRLKIIRVALSLIFFCLITFLFLDFGGTLSERFHVLAHLQFIPAIIMITGSTFILGHVVILLALFVLTLLFGRVYCSSICPMGVFQDIIAWFSKIFNKKKRYKFSPPKNILRWTIFAVSAVAFMAGFPLLLGLLEPYSAFGRMASNVISPVYIAGNNLLANIFISFNNYIFIPRELFIASISSFIVALLTLAAIGFLAWKYGRTFCNTVCPAGTILAFVSRFSLFKIQIDDSKCNHCGICNTKCKASCIDTKNQRIDDRCVSCFNCLGSCKRNALTYAPVRKKKPETVSLETPINESRRKFFATSAMVVGATCSVLAQNRVRNRNQADNCLRRSVPVCPPGAQSAANLHAHCTSCHLCVGKCPSNVLKPSFLEYGIGGIMQPVMTFEHGFCNFDCTVCSEICPNGALLPLTKEKKHRTQVGFVKLVEDKCVVHTDGTNCGACAEHCPTQAVRMIPYRNGLTIPHIKPDICVGCGGCEYICPVSPDAIFIEGNTVHREAKTAQKSEKIILDDNIGFGF